MVADTNFFYPILLPIYFDDEATAIMFVGFLNVGAVVKKVPCAADWHQMSRNWEVKHFAVRMGGVITDWPTVDDEIPF